MHCAARHALRVTDEMRRLLRKCCTARCAALHRGVREWGTTPCAGSSVQWLCSEQWWRVYVVLGGWIGSFFVWLDTQQCWTSVQANGSSITGLLLTFAFVNFKCEICFSLDLASCLLYTYIDISFAKILLYVLQKSK